MTNLAEFLNSALSSAREYPIMALIEYIRTMLMRWLYTRHAAAAILGLSTELGLNSQEHDTT